MPRSGCASRQSRPDTIFTVISWMLTAAGWADASAAAELRKVLADVLSQPCYGCALSSLHADTEPPLRVTPHLDHAGQMTSA
jgi:hypothetical protein